MCPQRVQKLLIVQFVVHLPDATPGLDLGWQFIKLAWERLRGTIVQDWGWCREEIGGPPVAMAFAGRSRGEVWDDSPLGWLD